MKRKKDKALIEFGKKMFEFNEAGRKFYKIKSGETTQKQLSKWYVKFKKEGSELLATADNIYRLLDSSPFMSQWNQRTQEEHGRIRKAIKVDPAVCSHIKGWSPRNPKTFLAKDYNLSLHRFVDGTDRIRCLSCGQKWFESDADWKKMLDLAAQSSNSKSSTEIPLGSVKDVKFVQR